MGRIVMSEEEHNLDRRKVLRNIAAAGSISLIGMTASVGASSKEASVDIDRLLQSDRIEKLKKEIPKLELSSEDARVLGEEQGVVAIPANHGTVLTRPSEETDAASFYFNEWVSGVDSDWVEGTEARLRVTDDGMVLTRAATDEETEIFLSSVDTIELDRENMAVAVQPETGKVTISHINTEDRRYDHIQAEPAETATEGNGLAAAKAGLEVTNRETEHFSGSSQGIGVQSSCDQDDVAFCIIEAASCAPCALTAGVPPALAACIAVVCFGVPNLAIITFLGDIGCISLAGCAVNEVVDIVNDMIDEYADQIPV